MRNSKGFTLIELLIVIGVLGILAAGLLAAVDPFEQLKKGRDSNRRNMVVEYHNANIRYYATHGDLPWNDNGASAACQAVDPVSAAVTLTGMSACTDELIEDGELKEEFEVALGADADKVYVTSNAAGVRLFVCFAPESKSLFQDDASRYDQDGSRLDGTGQVCEAGAKDNANVGQCYWCAK